MSILYIPFQGNVEPLGDSTNDEGVATSSRSLQPEHGRKDDHVTVARIT